MKRVNNGCLEVVVDTLALVIGFVIHEVLFRRWLPPVASALISALVVTLAFTPFYVVRHRFSAKRFIVFIGLTAGLILIMNKLTW